MIHCSRNEPPGYNGLGDATSIPRRPVERLVGLIAHGGTRIFP